MRSKNLWVGLMIGIIWLVVIITSLSAPELTFGDEPVSIAVAAVANWFWGLLGTVFVLRSTVFRRQDEMGWGQTEAWPWVTAAIGAIWLVALIAAGAAPDVTINDTITIPIGSIVAPPIAVALTLFACEFLITGFASRRPIGGS